MNDPTDFRVKWKYRERFDCVLAAGIDGFEVRYNDLIINEEPKKREQDSKMNRIFALFAELEGSKKNRHILYTGLENSLKKIHKNILLPYNSPDFNKVWGIREIEIFSEILIPDADFSIVDVFDRTCLMKIAADNSYKGNNLIAILDIDRDLSESLEERYRYIVIDDPNDKVWTNDRTKIYPVIGKTDEEIIKEFDIFLKKLYLAE